MKRVVIACLLAVLAVPAFAVIGTVDDVPGATLLLPYFEVDLDTPDGANTLMSINNASATAVLAHVTIWSDLSVHVLDFNVYLTGYDVQTISLYDILVNGNLPLTASAGQDPGDTISPHGPVSQDINFASCTGFLPYDNPALTEANEYLPYVQSALTGKPTPYFDWDIVPGGACGAVDYDDRIARGYVTVDTVNSCQRIFPDDFGYFTSPVATDQNVLWGDYFYVNTGENFAQGETLVHIEADPTLGINDYTFYYRYSGTDTSAPNSGGIDHREGLGNVFAARYITGGSFDGGTSYIVWRDSKHTIRQAACSSVPNPNFFPIGQTQIVMFDEEENLEVPDVCTISPCGPGDPTDYPFPWEAQRSRVGTDLQTSYDFGWAFLNLNYDNGGTPGQNFPLGAESLMQNWVTAVMDASGRFSVGFDAIQLGNVTRVATAPNPIIPVP